MPQDAAPVSGEPGACLDHWNSTAHVYSLEQRRRGRCVWTIQREGREECERMKAVAESLGLTVHEEIDDVYRAQVHCNPAEMLQLVKTLAALGQTSAPRPIMKPATVWRRTGYEFHSQAARR